MRAMQRGEPGVPVVLADAQDNPGAGGNGDTTGLLAALMRHRREAGARPSDRPRSASRAHQAGVAGARVHTGRDLRISGGAVYGRVHVESLGDGRFTCTGPMSRDSGCSSAAMARLRSRAAPGVRVVLASGKCQAADQEMFRHLGIEPRRERISA